MSITAVLRTMNTLQTEGLIGNYAIGGAMAIVFHAEPIATEDVDVFCFLKQSSFLLDLSALFKRLRELGATTGTSEYVYIGGQKVQILVPSDKLDLEALEFAQEQTLHGVKFRVFSPEHLIAIAVRMGRPGKDLARIAHLRATSTHPIDERKLADILARHGLSARWARMQEALRGW